MIQSLKCRTLGQLSTACLGLTLLPALATAQFGNEWVSFTKDNSRMSSANSVGLNDVEEKDYTWGDVDQDGWIDLVSVRKQPFTSLGHRTNVLYMNEGGVLVDRTAQYATNSLAAGDNGFNTPTNDRDAVLFDADNDGWLDIITATTLSIGTPKQVSHPRVYMNLGKDEDGNWLGFRYEPNRIPQLFIGSSPSFPKFCSVDAGDVTGDGFADLYFGDYDSGSSQGGDMNDRLLINDGTGHFLDESTMRMTNQMLQSAFGNSVAIQDFNNDGANDILKDTSLNAPTYVSISYNNPGNVGFFNLFDQVHGLAPYHTNTGDLNNDGRVDLVISDDGLDRFRYNLGVDAFGMAVWGPAKTFNFLWGADDGFGSNNLMADLDGDGWKDIIICDVDVDISGCNRRAHIYHNPGGAVGAEFDLTEEAQQSGSGGWKGVKGIMASDLTGSHDVAVFDLDNDGDNDMVLGRCAGTDVWMNDKFEPTLPGSGYCDCTTSAPCSNTGAPGEGCANSTGSGAFLWAAGDPNVAADTVVLLADNCPSGIPGVFFSAPNQAAPIAFGDGQLCVSGSINRLEVAFSNVQGLATSSISLSQEDGLTGGEVRNYQYWYRDVPGPCSGQFNTSNAHSIQW
jgi:hypothetical protein